jgi:four helix bundle protein
MSLLQSYKQLIVWQKSMELAETVYKVTELFPKTELYGLVSQIRRAVVSIPSNIAEGYGRSSPKEYGQFYSIAYGSLLELETQLTLSSRLDFLSSNDLQKTNSLIEEISKMLHVMILKTRRGGFSQLSPRS